MEIIILIAFYILFKFFITSLRNSENSFSNYNYEPNESELKLRVEIVEEIFDGKSIKFFKFYVKGMLKNRSKKMRIGLSSFDITEGKQNVLNLFSDLQFPNSEYFCYITKWIDMEFENAYYPEEIILVELPVESFVFPKKGRRILEFLIEIEDSIYDVVNSSKCIIDYRNDEGGYIDYRDKLTVAENAIVKMSIIIAGLDYSYQQVEVDLIKTFVKELSEGANHTSAERIKELNEITRNTIIITNKINHKAEITKLSAIVRDNADNMLKHKAIVFFLQLVSVDGKYSKEEHEMIELISQIIDYDPDRIRALKDKIIAVSIHDDLTDFASLLGITPSMNDEDKKRHLREEYRKWNQRVTHSDPTVRDQANRMLELISQERAKL